MSINFSTLKYLIIPEGRVKDIVNKDGVSLWGIKLTGISVTTSPNKTQYSEGEVFDPTGMVVSATYSNGETKEISSYSIINGDNISEDMPTVTISYSEDGVSVSTAYEVEFVPMYKITIKNLITSSYNTSPNGIEIDGQTYANPSFRGTTQITVPVGTRVRCFIQPGTAYVGHIYKGTIIPTSSEPTSYSAVIAERPKGSSDVAEYVYEVVGDTTFSWMPTWLYITEQ